jgi:signal transduction histidine kinase
LQHLYEWHLYGLALRPEGDDRCVVVGIAAGRIEALQDQIGLPRLLETVSGIAGIAYLRIEPKGPRASGENGHEIQLVAGPMGSVAEARLPMRTGDLVVGVDARQLASRIARLRQQFIVFAALLAVSGLLLSWLLYRMQSAYLFRMRTVERELARQREDAALGRAAASIAHEIRNPLNAISMGLQRLTIEAGDLGADQRELIETMRQAVNRTNGIVSDIQRFAHPLHPRRKPSRLDEITERILKLYRSACDARGIRVTFRRGLRQVVPIDPDMVAQAIENIVKNAVEAQTEEGFLRIEIRNSDGWIELSVENAGFAVPDGGADEILEPYFTTKTRGTGLGLSIAQRIAASHGGRLTVQHIGRGVLRTRLVLPLQGESGSEAEGESQRT